MRDTTAADVTAGLRALGVTTGDTVFFHSSLKSMGHVVGGAGKPHPHVPVLPAVRLTRAGDHVAHAFQGAVAEDGVAGGYAQSS